MTKLNINYENWNHIEHSKKWVPHWTKLTKKETKSGIKPNNNIYLKQLRKTIKLQERIFHNTTTLNQRCFDAYRSYVHTNNVIIAKKKIKAHKKHQLLTIETHTKLNYQDRWLISNYGELFTCGGLYCFAEPLSLSLILPHTRLNLLTYLAKVKPLN